MKKMIKKITALIVMFAVVCASMVLLPAGHAEAAKAKKPSFEESSYVLFYSNPDKSYVKRLVLKNVASDAQITDVKISKKILRQSGTPTSSGIYFYTLKTGTATVSCKVKQGGKTYTVKCKVTVKKADPFNYVKIDGKKVYDKGNNNICNYYTSQKTAKVSFKLNKGWKVKTLYTNDHNSETGTMSKNKTFKNGKKVTIKQGDGCYTSVKLDVENSKGEVYRFLICLHYGKAPSSASSSKGISQEPCATEIVIVESGWAESMGE